MADPTLVRVDTRSRPGVWAPYRAVLASRVRAQRVYRMSFALDVTSAVLIGFVEFAEMWVIVRAVRVLGGLDLPAMTLLFGLANVCWSLADMVAGHLDNLPTYLREGRLEAFYLRPQPVLAQLLASDISLRRLGRLTVGVGALGYGLVVAGVAWSPVAVLPLVLSVLSGTAIFAGLFVWAAGLQFFLVNAPEFANAFTYGGSYAATQPLPVLSPALRLLFGWVVPVTFVAYLPTVWLLGLPGAPGFPAWSAWCAPFVAVAVWVVGLLVWRWGSRHYQSGGG